VITAFVSVDEFLEEKWHVAQLQITAPAQLMRNVCRDILRPFLSGVERDDPNRAFVLTSIRSRMTVSRSAVSASISRQTQQLAEFKHKMRQWFLQRNAGP
jgi:hypothetical protein